MTATKNPAEIGQFIGNAIARDVIREDMPRRWTGLDAQDGDQALAAGLEPGTPEWDAMEAAARVAYEIAIANAL